MAKKILVVDDELDILKTVVFRLKNSGFEVVTAESGDEAIEKAKAHLPDLILLDLRLPVKDGFEVCETLRDCKDLEEVPVIFLTASTGVDLDKEMSDCKAQGLVLKPFEFSVLLEKIKEHIK